MPPEPLEKSVALGRTHGCAHSRTRRSSLPQVLGAIRCSSGAYFHQPDGNKPVDPWTLQGVALQTG